MLRTKFNITNYVIFVPFSSVMDNKPGESMFEKFADIGAVVASQVAASFYGHDGGLVTMKGDNGVWLWKAHHYGEMSRFYPEGNWFTYLFNRLSHMLMLVFFFAVLSVLSGIALRIGVTSIVVFYILAVKLLRRTLRINYSASELYEAFPWIGALSAYLARKGRSDSYVLAAYFGFCCFGYLFLAVCYYVWTELFLRTRPYDGDDRFGYFLYLQISELFALVFLRTRISIRYFPRIFTAYNLVYLSYLYTYFFPFTTLALWILVPLTVATGALFLFHMEEPALKWDEYDRYRPAHSNPRQAYIPVPLMNFSFGFDLWTVFYPPAFRSEFSQTEQSHIGTQVEMLQYDFSVDRMPNPNANQDELLVQVQPGNNGQQPAYEMQERNAGNGGNNGNPLQEV